MCLLSCLPADNADINMQSIFLFSHTYMFKNGKKLKSASLSQSSIHSSLSSASMCSCQSRLLARRKKEEEEESFL
jgi:hypothetical protein